MAQGPTLHLDKHLSQKQGTFPNQIKQSTLISNNKITNYQSNIQENSSKIVKCVFPKHQNHDGPEATLELLKITVQEL